jgi:hypothetical protein
MHIIGLGYGPLAFVVKYAFCALAVATAIISKVLNKTLVPCEEDLPGLARTLATVSSAIGVAILIYLDRKYPDDWHLSLLVVLGVAFVANSILYAILNSKFTILRTVNIKKLTLFQRLKSLVGITVPEEKISYVLGDEKIVKGLCFTPEVENIRKLEPSETEEEIFRGRGYNAPDKTWRYRSIVKALFIVSYLALVLFGCLALADVGLLLAS